MSKIGKKIIIIPVNVKIQINNSIIIIIGDKGKLSFIISELLIINRQKDIIQLTTKENTKKAQELYGFSRSIIYNMIIGVSKGFIKELIIKGLGYKSQIKNNNLILNIGYSHLIYIYIKKDINIKIKNNTTILIEGINKEIVGQVAATIRANRPPEPYKKKGIHYKNEILRKKIGKTGK
uniref:50S ribosomal protein L6 n=1 Tax=Choreocolax polysiphoniae TaxID=282351 RepID=A0A0B5VUJ5_9FLOR|nr:50S ribosomal protein L6 [Choreocolax polysiphoniae]AJH65858.1 50S ribosomal protein L6 [Choreocolax polysiphoniae]